MVSASISFTGDENVAKDVEEFVNNHLIEDYYYVSGKMDLSEGVKYREMLWETLRAWDDNFVDKIDEDKWDELNEFLKKYPDIKLSVSSMFNADLYHPLVLPRIDEIKKEIYEMNPDISDDEINENGLIRFYSSAEYQWNPEEENVDTLFEELNRLDIADMW